CFSSRRSSWLGPAARPSALVDVVELVRLLRDDEEVEREHPRADPREGARRRVDRAELRALADHVANRRPEALHLLDHEARVRQELLERVDGEEPRVGEVENAALPVVELAEQQARAQNVL